LSLRLWLLESWKRMLGAERSGSGTEAELHLLRTFEGLDPRRFGSCSGGSLVAGTERRRSDSGDRPGGSLRGIPGPLVREPPTEGLPPFTREERLQREFPRCGHYLLRAFEGLDPRRFGDRSGGSLVAGTCRVWPAGKRYGEREARPAAIAHGDFRGKLGLLRCSRCGNSSSRHSFRCGK
jgi:hypothetical protein